MKAKITTLQHYTLLSTQVAAFNGDLPIGGYLYNIISIISLIIRFFQKMSRTIEDRHLYYRWRVYSCNLVILPSIERTKNDS